MDVEYFLVSLFTPFNSIKLTKIEFCGLYHPTRIENALLWCIYSIFVDFRSIERGVKKLSHFLKMIVLPLKREYIYTDDNECVYQCWIILIYFSPVYGCSLLLRSMQIMNYQSIDWNLNPSDSCFEWNRTILRFCAVNLPTHIFSRFWLVLTASETHEGYWKYSTRD